MKSNIYLISFSFLFVQTLKIQAQWIQQLPQEVQDSIYWAGDHEEGDLSDWTMDAWQYPGGGIFNTGGNEVEAVSDDAFAHSGMYSARSTITQVWRAENGSRAVRLMRWTDKAWDDGVDHFPKASYYSSFYYFPHAYNPNKYEPWDPGDGGWWNIFQFKSQDEEEESQPVWTLNVYHDDEQEEMSLYLYSKYNAPHSYPQTGIPIKIPVQQWVHLEAFYRASDPNTPNGEIKIWQDGVLILEASQVITVLDQENIVWGIGNYTNHIDGGPNPGSATLYFDDCIVSTVPIHSHLEETSTSTRLRYELGEDYVIYPNPVHDKMRLKFEPEAKLQIFDLLGRQYAVKQSERLLELSHLRPGVYVLIHGGKTWSFVKK